MDVNFELYKIFYHVAKLKSFSKAADLLCISQSAVSQSIKNLEHKLDVQLFIRQHKKINLSWEGILLFQHIDQAYNFIKEAEKKIVEISNMSWGEIRLGASDTVCKHYVIPYIEIFSKHYPGIKFQAVNRTSSQIINILKKGSIDLGIVSLPVEDKQISVREFEQVEDIFVASDKYIELKGKAISFNELSKYPLLLLDKKSMTRQMFDSFLYEKSIILNPEIEMESIDLLIEFAKIGFGIAHVMKKSVINELKMETLFEVKINERLPLRQLGICTLSNVPLSKAAERFIGFLNEKTSTEFDA